MFRDRFFKRDRFFNGFRYDSPFQKGDLKYVILDLLKEKPRYGYEIIRYLEESSHGFYKPSAGTVYPTLQMLEEMSYATSKERDGKKVYKITKQGIDFLNERSDFADQVKDHMRHQWDHGNFKIIGHIIGEVAKLRRFLVFKIRYTSPEKIEKIGSIITKARQEIESLLEE
jgi:DNA-binding PadR family transcriptional regulator